MPMSPRSFADELQSKLSLCSELQGQAHKQRRRSVRQLRKGSSRSSVLSDTLDPSVYEEVIRLSQSRRKSLRVKEKAKMRKKKAEKAKVRIKWAHSWRMIAWMRPHFQLGTMAPPSVALNTSIV